MDAAEYWILDSVHEAWYPLALLVSPDIGLIYNRPTHGLAYEALVAVLERLFQRGDLAAELVERLVARTPIQPTRAEIEAALAGTLKMDYGLSASGGARWEAVTQPDWDRYLYAGFGTDPDEGEIITADRAIAARYLSILPLFTDMTPVPDSQTWDILQPWSATYWKTRPVGHRVQFRYTSTPADLPRQTPPDVTAWVEQLYRWYTPYQPPSSE